MNPEGKQTSNGSQEKPWPEPGLAGRSVLAIGTILFGLGVYKLVQMGTTSQGYHFESAWDHRLPFVPEMIVIYIGCFPFLFVSATQMEVSRFWRALLTMLLVCAGSWVCFFLFPSSVTRPDPGTIESEWLRWIFVRLHEIDDPHNSFPSLHVSTTWICAIALLGRKSSGFWIFCAILISLSTMLVEQHTIADVLGGMGMAALGWTASVPIMNRIQKYRSRADHLPD